MGPIEPLTGPRTYGEQGALSELELKLRKIGIPVSQYQIITHPNLFSAAEILKTRFKYQCVEMDNIRDSGGHKGQVDRILELSSIENITSTLEALAKSGYKLKNDWRGLSQVPCILKEDVDVIKNISLSLGLEAYLSTLEKIKKSLGMRNASYTHSHASGILSLASLKEEQWAGVDALCKCGYISFSNYHPFDDSYLIEKIAKSDTKKFLNVFNTLKKRFGYNSVDMENLHGAGNSRGQVERILELSNMKGVCEILDILADAGYKLDTEWRGLSQVPCISTKDIEDIKKLIKGKLYKKEYSQLITKLEKQLEYKNIKKDYEQLLKLADFFSKFRSDICEKTITLLTERDYKSIVEKRWVSRLPPLIGRIRQVTEEDVSEMKKVAYELWEKELDNIKLENKCLYKENTEAFIELFSNLKETEQKTVIKTILNCDYYNKEIADWLDKNYPNLIREVGLSP